MLPPATVGLRPWIGSAALHLVFIALIAGFAIRWRAEPPLPQLAIQGSVVRYEDLPPSVRSGKPLRESVPVPTQPPPPVTTRPEPKPEPPPDPAVEQQRVAEEQAREHAEQAQQQKQKLAEQQARDAAALAQQKRVAAQAEAERKRKADEANKKEALEVTQRQQQAAKDAKAKADREARARAEREAELKRALASEEEGEAIQRSGVVDEYRALLTQTIERNWIRPPSAKPGLECTLNVTQATGGTVLAVAIGACNGDQAVRESITNAVYRSSPLPAPRDPRVFERRLVIVFKPSE